MRKLALLGHRSRSVFIYSLKLYQTQETGIRRKHLLVIK